jgi:hypothetical protein
MLMQCLQLSVVDLSDPDSSLFIRIRIIPSSKKLDLYLCLLYDFISLKNDVMYLQKVTGILQVTDEKSRIRIRKSVVRSRSSDPDLYQNVTDPEH